MSTADDLSANNPAAATAPPEPAAAPPAGGQRKAAVSGALWIGIGFGTSYIVRLASSMILTRLLVQEVYGLMDMAMVFIQGLHMFADVGIGTSVIQSKHGDDPRFLNTAWTMQLLRGLFLWGATALIAWPVAAFYGESVLILLMPAIGTTAAIDGVCSTAVFTLRRRLDRSRLVMMELAASVTGTCLTIAWVWWVRPNVWGFVVGSLMTSATFMGLSYVVLPGYRNRFEWDRDAVHELLHFGRWIFFSTIITFLAFQADRLLVPKLFGVDVMGVYGRAVGLAAIATGLMSTFSTQLVFPLYSKLQHSGRDIRSNFRRVHSSAATFAAVLVTGMLSAGPAAVHVLYGPLYQEAGWMLQFLAVGAWFQMLESTTGASLMALGQPRSVMASNAARLIAALLYVPVGYFLGAWLGIGGPEGGTFVGMLLAFIAADFTRYLVTVWMARQHGMSAVSYDIGLSLYIVLASVAALQITQLLWPGRVRPEFVGALAISPDAVFPGNFPWASWHLSYRKDWWLLLLQFGTSGTAALLMWAGLLVLWRFRQRWGRAS